MKKKLIKFLITISILLTAFNTNILAQNRISGEKLEKLLTENHIIIYDFFGPLRNNIELNFNANKTYKLNGVFPISAISIHPSSGNWEIVGFGNSSVRLTDIQNQNQYSDKKASFQLLFGDDGNIYNLNQKLYSYRLENKKERIENNARRIEEERIAEELRLKKIEEEKRQLAIKREQERIKAEQIKKEEERKRLELAEWAKKEEEERIKRENEERIKLEREELFKNILKYSLILIGIIIIAGVIYYVNKFHKNKAKNLFLNLKNSFNNKSFDKKFFNKILNKFTTLRELISSPSQSLNLKDFNINKSTIFKMINYNIFKIKFKKKILKEEFFEFLNKNLENKSKWRCSALDSQVFQFNILNSFFRYQWGNNYKYAEEISNLVNKKFSSLESLTNDEIFEFKSLLSEKLQDDGKITIGNKIILWIGIPFIGLILWSNINSSTTTNELCKCPCYQTLNIPHTYYDPKTGNYTHTPQYHNFLRDHCK
jgi:hypothetical protein